MKNKKGFLKLREMRDTVLWLVFLAIVLIAMGVMLYLFFK
jgi:hypothetical protein